MDMTALYADHPELEVVEQSGWHRVTERRAVLRLAPKNGVGAELGVFSGMFMEHLANDTQAKKIYFVDPWSKLHGDAYPNWGRYTANTRLPTASARRAVEYRASSLATECEVVEDFASDWIDRMKDRFLDWAYLDANHSYGSVINDLTHIDRALREKGVIMGDDCWVRPDFRNSDVYYAVHDFCKDHGYRLLHMDDQGQWAITRDTHPGFIHPEGN